MSKGDARNLSIGQGYLDVTPIQAVNMLASLLRGRYQPVRLVVDQLVESGWHVGFSQEATALARQGMFEVVNTAGGTAQQYVRAPGVSIAGKTGSAQAPTRRIGWDIKYTDQNGKVIVDRISDWDSFVETSPVPREQISRSAVTWPTLRAEDRLDKLGRKRHILHAWFVGYAPADNPKVAVVVLIEYGMHGNSQAGPVARDIILKCLELGYFGQGVR